MSLIYKFLVCCFCITGIDDVDSPNNYDRYDNPDNFYEKSKDKSQ